MKDLFYCKLPIYHVTKKGFFDNIGEEKEIALQQAKDFYDGLVTEDIFNIKDIPLIASEQKARLLLRSYSRNIASQESNAMLLKDVSANGTFDSETLSKYLLALQRLYVVEEMDAWNTNLRSKTAIRKKATRYFVDPSIATSALGITPENIFTDMHTLGLLFESLAIRDLRIYADSNNAKVYLYRDSLDREANAVIPFDNGEWALIGIKMGDEQDVDFAAKKLIRLSKDIVQEKEKPTFLMIITKNKFAYQREDGVYVVL